MRTAHAYYDRDEVELAPALLGWYGLAIGFCAAFWYGVFRGIEYLCR